MYPAQPAGQPRNQEENRAGDRHAGFLLVLFEGGMDLETWKTALLVTHDISEAISMSDRVIILSKAPACVRCEIPVFTVLTDRTPMQMRNAPEFKQYFQQIWKELNHDT